MKYCMIPTLFDTVLLGFLDFSQKPPGDLIPTAKRLISGEQLVLFWVELPGNDEFLPSDATLFAFGLVVSLLI